MNWFETIARSIGLRAEASQDETFRLDLPPDSQNILGLFGHMGPQVARNSAIRYPPIARAVTLIAGVCAGIVTNGNLTVVDRNRRRVRSARARAAHDVLTYTADGGVKPSYQLVKDLFADYLLEGNAIAGVSHDSGGNPTEIIRYMVRDAETTPRNGKVYSYRLRDADDPSGATMIIPARSVAHCRWPQMSDYTYTYAQWDRRFAPSPISLLGSRLRWGLDTDEYLRKFLDGGGKLFLNLSHENKLDRPLTREQKIEIQRFHNKAVKTGDGTYLSFDADAQSIMVNGYSKVPKEQRDDNERSIAMFYGLPLPLLSANVEQWVKGINEQVMRLAVTTCFAIHMESILKPLALRMLHPGDSFRVDYSDLLRGDAVSLAQFAIALNGDAQRGPLASREEIRQICDFPADVEGDFATPIVESRNNPPPG